MAVRRRVKSREGELQAVIDRADASLRNLDTDASATFDGTLLAAAVAHEVRNALTPVRSYADLALAKPDDRQLVKAALLTAIAAAERACLAAEAIIESARRRHDDQPSDVEKAVAAAAEIVCRGIEFHVEQRIESGLLAPIGQTALEHVLLNLLLNAKAAMGGRGETAITASRDGGGLHIAVADLGRGIPEDQIGTVFRPFVSGSSRQGSGLGLTICRFLVEAAGGRIEVESQPGRGSCFNIYFPSRPTAAAA